MEEKLHALYEVKNTLGRRCPGSTTADEARVRHGVIKSRVRQKRDSSIFIPSDACFLL